MIAAIVKIIFRLCVMVFCDLVTTCIVTTNYSLQITPIRRANRQSGTPTYTKLASKGNLFRLKNLFILFKVFVHRIKCFGICCLTASAQAARKYYQSTAELAVAFFKLILCFNVIQSLVFPKHLFYSFGSFFQFFSRCLLLRHRVFYD